jgi:predicted Ser/Thr protein kinase
VEREPREIGRYEVERRLGQGGMGEVYLARDPAIGRLVAVKMLRLEGDEYRRRFKIEVTTAGGLRHQHIVTIFDSGEHEGWPYLAMEFIPGETLAEKIARRDPLPLAEKLRYVEELCDGLAHAHKAGIVHRDIKPANVIVDRDNNRVKILDFGIARVVNAGMTQTGIMLGTLTYMSPEQVSGGAIDQRTDVFATGLVLYELLAGVPAFPGGLADGLLHRIAHENPIPLATLVPGLDSRVIAIVTRALQKDPGRRYENTTSMAADLAAARSQLDASPSLDTTTISTTRALGAATHILRRAVTAAIAIVAIALTLWAAATRRRPPAHPERESPTPSRAEEAAPSPPAPSVRTEVAPPAPVTTTLAPAPSPSPAPVGRSVPAQPSADTTTVETQRRRALTAAEDLYQRGDGERALAAVEASHGLYPRDASFDRLLRRLYADAERRADAAEARARTTLGPAATDSPAFRRGDEKKNQATATLKQDMPGSVRALWSAADLFEIAASDTRLTTPIRPPEQPESESNATSAQPDTPRPPPQVARQSDPQPAPVTVAPPAAPSPAPPTAEEEITTIERLLNEYRSAYEALDIRRVLKVYPTLPNADALARAFGDAREVRIGFSRPVIKLTGASAATASFNRTQEIVPKVGKATPDKRPITVQLRKDGANWLIADVR